MELESYKDGRERFREKVLQRSWFLHNETQLIENFIYSLNF